MRHAHYVLPLHDRFSILFSLLLRQGPAVPARYLSSSGFDVVDTDRCNKDWDFMTTPFDRLFQGTHGRDQASDRPTSTLIRFLIESLFGISAGLNEGEKESRPHRLNAAAADS